MVSLVIADRPLEYQPSIAQLQPGYPSWTGAGLLSRKSWIEAHWTTNQGLLQTGKS